MSRNTSFAMSQTDAATLNSFSSDFDSWVKQNTVQTKGKGRTHILQMEEETMTALIETVARAGRKPAFLPGFSEERGRTNLNWRKGREWALKYGACPVQTVEAYREERVADQKEFATRAVTEKTIVAPWTAVPEDLREIMYRGLGQKEERGYIPNKIRTPRGDFDPEFKPSHICVVVRKGRHSWRRPEIVIAGTLKAIPKEQREAGNTSFVTMPAVLRQAIIWDRSKLAELARFIGSEHIPSFSKGNKDQVPVGEVKLDTAPEPEAAFVI